MSQSKKNIGYITPRHYRILFFVDVNIPIQVLFKLIQDNYRLWGGRYNPIIPVKDNTIEPSYLEIVKSIDPDLIYYSQTIDKNNLIKQCHFLHPKDYLVLREDIGNNFPGIYSGYLLSEEFKADILFSGKLALIHFSHDIDESTASFYQLSFGFSPVFVEDTILLRGFKSIPIQHNNFSSINQLIHEERPFFTNLLSEINEYTNLVESSNDWEANKFELIIYDQENPFKDLLYFWNRRLFQDRQKTIKQIIASKEQIEILVEDSFFEAFLYESFYQSRIFVTSASISATDLTTITNSINQKIGRINFQVSVTESFPYQIFRSRHSDYKKKNTAKRLLSGQSDYLKLQQPFPHNFLSGIKGEYICDLELSRENASTENFIRFPYYTTIHSLVSDHPCRISNDHNLSFFVKEADKGIDISVPNDTEIIRRRLMYREEFGNPVSIPIGYPAVSPAGMKLSSFIELLNAEWHVIDECTSDSFWLLLFMGNTIFDKAQSFSFNKKVKENEELGNFYIKLPGSNINNNGDFFSRKDLENELRHYYFHYKGKIIERFKAENLELDDEDLVAFIEKSIKEDFSSEIDRTLQYFVERNAMFIGMRVKCLNCSSNAWYSLKYLNNKMECQGCLKTISPSVTGHLYFKFNDVIVNNLKSGSAKTKMSYDGNYLVLRTLVHFATSSRQNSFLYSPCMDIEMQDGKEKVKTDLDILVVVNGKLIIGEAKIEAKDFNNKQIKQLIWIGNHIRPDKIILAYQDGPSLDDKIQKIKEGINHQECEVISYKAGTHWHRFGRIFGCGIEEK